MENQATNVTTEHQFVKLADLTAKEVKKFQRLPMKFVKTLARSGREQVSIMLTINDPYFKALNLRAGGPKNYITAEFFNRLMLEIPLDPLDEKGRTVTEWRKLGPVRFVKGHYKESEGEYHSVECIFKQGLYLTHFFDYEQLNLIKTLEQKKLISIDWVERPDAIEQTEDLLF